MTHEYNLRPESGEQDETAQMVSTSQTISERCERDCSQERRQLVEIYNLLN